MGIAVSTIVSLTSTTRYHGMKTVRLAAMLRFTAQSGTEYVETTKMAPFPSSCPTDMWIMTIRAMSCMNIYRDINLYLTVNSIYSGSSHENPKLRVRLPLDSTRAYLGG